MRPLIYLALSCGSGCAALTFLGLKTQSLELEELPFVGMEVGVALLMALFGASFIASVHVPSGH